MRSLLPSCNGLCRTLGEVLTTEHLTQESLSYRYLPEMLLPNLSEAKPVPCSTERRPARTLTESGKRSFRCRACLFLA